MKKVLKKILNFILWCISWILNLKVYQKIKRIKDTIITYSVRRNLVKCGRNFRIETPFIAQGLKYISVGKDCMIHSNVRLEAIDNFRGKKYNPKIILGDNVIINNFCHIGAIDEIKIGNNVLIASKVFITDHFHGKTDIDNIKISPAERELFLKGKVSIEENVWIGENVAILSGVTIGKNSIVGANSVVTKDVPDNTVVVGAPARVIKYL